VDDVLNLLSRLDPYGLQPGSRDEAPPDEYRPEAQPMASLLSRHGQITASEVDAIWRAWFNEPLSAVIGERITDFVQQLTELTAGDALI
jgi:hypothetical protein